MAIIQIHNGIMEQRWQNSQTGVEVGVNTILGSPRAWVNRAVGCKYQDLGQLDSSLHPTQLTVAGVWPRNHKIIDTGPYQAIYRYFELPANFYTTTKFTHLRPMIGVAVAVPSDLILPTQQAMRALAAEWTWWSLPSERPKSTYMPVTERAQIDHAEVYKLFDQGLDAITVAQQQNLSPNSVRYIHAKWLAGKPAQSRKTRPTLNHEAILQDLREGIYGMKEIADRNGTTRTTVWKIRKSQGFTI